MSKTIDRFLPTHPETILTIPSLTAMAPSMLVMFDDLFSPAKTEAALPATVIFFISGIVFSISTARSAKFSALLEKITEALPKRYHPFAKEKNSQDS